MGKISRRLAAGFAASLALSGPAQALGPDDYVGSIVLMGSSYCPKGTLEADGQTLPVNSFLNLFSVFGSRFGGDGRSTFGLPNLRDKAMVSGLRYCVVVDGKLPPHN